MNLFGQVGTVGVNRQDISLNTDKRYSASLKVLGG